MRTLDSQKLLDALPPIGRGGLRTKMSPTYRMLAVKLLLVLIVGVILGIVLTKYMKTSEGFDNASDCSEQTCKGCGTIQTVCSPCAPCPVPDLSKYVLKASIPPCPSMPDLHNYVLKSQIPPVPDMTKYVLKSSIPRQQPVILDCSKCNKPSGECPPCPRPRCPEL